MRGRGKAQGIGEWLRYESATPLLTCQAGAEKRVVAEGAKGTPICQAVWYVRDDWAGSSGWSFDWDVQPFYKVRYLPCVALVRGGHQHRRAFPLPAITRSEAARL